MANLVTFAKKLWKDKVGGNTPITAAELNRMEGGINDCANQINKLGDSVSRSSLSTVVFSYKAENGHCQIRFTDCNLTLFFSSNEIGIWDSTTLTTLWSQQFGKQHSVSRVPAFWGDVTSITYGSWGSGDDTYIQMQFCLKDGKSLYATISKAEGIQLQYGTTGNIKTLWTKQHSVCQLDPDGSTTECTVKLSSGKEIIITAKNKLGHCVSLNCYANEIVIYDEVKKTRIVTYVKTSQHSVSSTTKSLITGDGKNMIQLSWQNINGENYLYVTVNYVTALKIRANVQEHSVSLIHVFYDKSGKTNLVITFSSGRMNAVVFTDNNGTGNLTYVSRDSSKTIAGEDSLVSVDASAYKATLKLSKYSSGVVIGQNIASVCFEQHSVSPLKTFAIGDKSSVTLSFKSANHSAAFLLIDNNGAPSVIFLNCMDSTSKILAGQSLRITFPNKTTAVIGAPAWSIGVVMSPTGCDCSFSIAQHSVSRYKYGTISAKVEANSMGTYDVDLGGAPKVTFANAMSANKSVRAQAKSADNGKATVVVINGESYVWEGSVSWFAII